MLRDIRIPARFTSTEARYLTLLILTLLALIVRAILTPIMHLTPFATTPFAETDFSLLPTTKQDLKRREEDNEGHRSSNSSNSSTSSTHSNGQNLAPRTAASRTRSVSPAKGYGLPSSQVRFTTPPLATSLPSYGERTWVIEHDFSKDKANGYTNLGGKGMKATPLQVIWREASQSIWRVAWVTVLVYLFLVYYG